MSDLARSGKSIVFATVAVVLIFLQFTLLSAALDLVTSFVLFGVGYIAGRFTR
ncbi:hypothetical protein [Neorhizobium sp. DAR64872/K0K18]|uniref:hypothetical protein n=1 Tax=Neorhizobium sp. DAR64872/K0K18 TaxID=3421958 RepID=UPI003D2CC82B